jgi:hypothetical protein
VLREAVSLDLKIRDGKDAHDALPPNRADLDFDVDDLERLGADVDLHETGVDGLVKLPEARDKADGAWIVRCE